MVGGNICVLLFFHMICLFLNHYLLKRFFYSHWHLDREIIYCVSVDLCSKNYLFNSTNLLATCTSIPSCLDCYSFRISTIVWVLQLCCSFSPLSSLLQHLRILIYILELAYQFLLIKKKKACWGFVWNFLKIRNE